VIIRRQEAGGRRQEGRKKVAREKGIISDYPNLILVKKGRGDTERRGHEISLTTYHLQTRGYSPISRKVSDTGRYCKPNSRQALVPSTRTQRS